MMMLMRKEQQELTGGGGGGKVNTWARACDTCGASPCRVYCRADGAYLCNGCDANVHAPHFRHERVPVCESCERAPAAFLCKADDASLCAACDADVHSANPLARRHHRVPIIPLYGPSSAAAATGIKRGATQQMEEDEFDEEDEDEAASWLLPNPTTHADKGNKINPNDTNTNGYFLGADVDEYLDLVEYTSGPAGDNLQLSTDDHEPHFDSVVPAGISHLGLDLDFDIKSGFAYNNNNSSHFTQSVSVSSLDVGVVPESTMSEISTTNQQQQQPPPKGTTIDLFSCHSIQQIPLQLSPMDREARVMRYREKKKTRKFEKTIRYASRKAYAETRPRIKGRFAKRINGADQVQIMADGGYGVVPSF